MEKAKKPLEILVIDDEPEILGLYTAVIKGHGSNARIAANGEEGVEIYKERYNGEKPFDGVITDLTMPVKDGLYVLEEVRKINENALVYVVTGNEVEGLEELKPNGVIKKPFKLKDIRAALDEIQAKKAY